MVMTELSPQPRPWLTADLPGIGGILKAEPADFVVEELPAYLPVGEGEHLFLWVEKTGVAAEQLTRHIARVLELPAHEIGVAGLKDRWAITRQYVSIPSWLEPRVSDLATPQIRILSATRHTNKLKTGHLRGNRFTIRLRDVSAEAATIVPALCERITRLGFPNYYGEQRFGHDGQTLTLGQALLNGTRRPGSLPASRRQFLLRMALSAVQSELFNRALAARLTDGLLHTVLVGDVMQVAATGGPFEVLDVTREQPRYDAGEIVISGPMFGPRMRQPNGVPGEREAELLASSGLSLDDFARFPKLLAGTRRAYVVRPAELACSLESQPTVAGDEPRAAAESADSDLHSRLDLILQVQLPTGVYATTLLDEFRKPASNLVSEAPPEPTEVGENEEIG